MTTYSHSSILLLIHNQVLSSKKDTAACGLALLSHVRGEIEATLMIYIYVMDGLGRKWSTVNNTMVSF